MSIDNTVSILVNKSDCWHFYFFFIFFYYGMDQYMLIAKTDYQKL